MSELLTRDGLSSPQKQHVGLSALWLRVPACQLQRRYAVTQGAEVTAYALGRLDGALGIKHSYFEFRAMGCPASERADYLRGIEDAEKAIEWARCMDALALPASKEADPVQQNLDFGGE